MPGPLTALQALALDLRWTWSHEGDALWSHVDEDLWELTHNPWIVLQTTSSERFQALVQDSAFMDELVSFTSARDQYLQAPSWLGENQELNGIGGIGFFSMEFGLGAALPLYAGGLGVAVAGAINGYIYAGLIKTARSVDDYTVRIVLCHDAVFLPTELPLIAWQR